MSYLQDALAGLKQVQVGLDAMQELDLGPETKAKLQLLIDNAKSCMAECRSLSAAYSALRERTERGEDVAAQRAPLDERVAAREGGGSGPDRAVRGVRAGLPTRR